MRTPDIEEVYQVIGEFVVFFQAVEDMYRRLGWQVIDPEKKAWPPLDFRKDTTANLIDKVTEHFVGLAGNPALPNGRQKAQLARELQTKFHTLRLFRNRLLHSTFTEIGGGAEVVDIIRVSPRLAFDPETGEATSDSESFDPGRVRAEIARHGQAFFQLHSLQIQAIHWLPRLLNRTCPKEPEAPGAT